MDTASQMLLLLDNRGAGSGSIPLPDFSLASSYELIVYPPGLVLNTTNEYGTVDVNGKATLLKSIAPGPTGRDFASTGVAPDFTNNVLQFNGDGNLVHNIAGNWNFLSFNSPATAVKHTVTSVCLFEETPNGTYGIVGNNGAGSTGNKGFDLFFFNSAAAQLALGSHIVRGGSPAVIVASQGNIYPKRVWKVLTIVTDISQTAANREKVYIDGVQVSYTVTSTSTAVATTPTYNLDIGALGNALGRMVGQMAFLSIQSVAELNIPYINSLLPQNNRTIPVECIVDRSKLYAQTTFLDDTDYYLNVAISRNPITNKYLIMYGHWSSAGHTWSETNRCDFQTTDNLLTFSGPQIAYDPPGTLGTLDVGFFYDSSGIGWGFTNQSDGTGTTITPGTNKLICLKTIDDGANWTTVEVTQPSGDGLDQASGYGNGFTQNGYNYYCVYRTKADTTASARYLLKWAVGASISTVEWILVDSGSDYINEGTIAPMPSIGPDAKVYIARREADLYTQYYSTDNFVTKTATNFNLGDSSILKGPGRLSTFNIDGVPCLAFYYPLKSTPSLKVVYTKVSDIPTLGTSAWVGKSTLVTGAGQTHYGTVIHYNNNFNGFGIYTRENNLLISFPTPSTNYLTIKTALGL